MAKLKYLLLILVLYCSGILTQCRYEDRSFSYEYEDDSQDEMNSDICSEGESLLSSKDMKEKVEDIAHRLHIQDNIINSFYEKAKNVNTKYLDKLGLNKTQKDGPSHLKHILEGMEHIRLEIGQFGSQIAAKASEIDDNREKYIDVIQRSEKMLDELRFFSSFCERFCENDFGRIIYQGRDNHDRHDRYRLPTRTARYTSNKHCWIIRELNKEISDQLQAFEGKYIDEIKYLIDDKDQEYANKVVIFNKQVREDALTYFGPTMYDILVLQDKYYHLAQVLLKANVSLNNDEMKIKTLNIEKILIGLERDIKKYGSICIACIHSKKTNRDVRKCDAKLDKSLYELIDDEIDEIKKNIQDNITDIFSELEKGLNGPVDVETIFEAGLKDDIQREITYAQNALDSMEIEVEKFSTNDAIILLQKLETVLQDLIMAEEFLNGVLW